MVTAEELTVAIRSEGIGETQQDLEGVEQSMQDTADSAGKSAEELEGFSQRFQGAMSAAVTALAIGGAGLATQVPVLGELFAGLSAIVSALAYQVDGVLRPVLTPVTNQFFEWANAIFNAEGAAGTLLGVATTLGSILAVVGAAAIKLGVTWASVTSAASTVAGALTTVGSVLAGIVGGITATTAALAIAIAALVGFVAAYLTNWRGVRDKTNAIIGSIVNFVVSGFKTLGTKALNAVTEFAGDVRTFFTDLASDLSSWASDLASDARGWGANIITRFLDGIRSMLGVVRDVLDDIPFIGKILDLFDRLSDAISDIDLSGEASATFEGVFSGSATASGNSGRAGSGGGSGRPTFRGSSGSGTTVLDGRQITESTGRYRSGPGRRRGL